MTKDEAMTRFRRDVCDKSEEIDSEEEHEWWALSYGFFLALGFSPDDANVMATEVRYEHEYWQ